jgi:hypothetical protein
MENMPSPVPPPTSIPHSGIPRWKIVVALLLIALIGFAAWQYPTWKRQSEVGAAYGARMGCSCRYVQGRDIASCRTDAEPGMEIVSIEHVESERAVRASVPLLASRIARYEGATGCVLVAE